MAHLEDLFEDGKLVVISYPGQDDVEIWMARPNVVQQKDIQKRARAVKARRKQEFMDKSGDERLALDLEADDLDKKTLVERLVDAHSQELMQQATNEVMFNPDIGSNWGDEGEDYLAIVDATLTRLEEIQRENEEAEEADRIMPMDDPELQRLNAEQERFNNDVQERYKHLVSVKRHEVSQSSEEDLRKKFREDRIEQECNMAWYEEYRVYQVYYACRYPEDHNKLYFSRADKVLGMPPGVRQQLFDAFDEIDVAGLDLKNLLTSLSS